MDLASGDGPWCDFLTGYLCDKVAKYYVQHIDECRKARCAETGP